MGKESFENKCMDDFMTCSCMKETKRYIAKMRSLVMDGSWSESPDFILRDNMVAYGIEHFVIDMYQCDNRSGSKVTNEEQQDIYNINHSSLVNGLFNVEQACEDLQKHLQKQFEIISSFEYERYIEEVDRIFDKHARKINRYNSRMNEKYVQSHLFFMIEMHHGLQALYSKYYPIRCIRNDGAVINKSCVDMIPMTEDFVGILKRYVGKMDGVICMSYSFNNVLTKMVYMDLSSVDKLYDSLTKQKIDVYRRFDYKFPFGNITLKLEE